VEDSNFLVGGASLKPDFVTIINARGACSGLCHVIWWLGQWQNLL